MANKKVIIDNRMRQIEKQKLQNMGYEIIEIQTSPNVYTEISSHVDIFACKIENEIIVEPTQNINNISNKIYGKDKVLSKYPFDIKYNVCIIGNKAIHNLKYTDEILKKELVNKGFELINTTQGYTNCSIAVINDSSAIVKDKGLNKILQKNGIDTLYLSNELDIKLLNGKQYSNKRGFIGGCISQIDNKIIVFGELKKIDPENKIREFIQKRNLEIIEFSGLDIIDYGGLIEIE